jgi:glycosyltransferase involved in cell wall biosynthesis
MGLRLGVFGTFYPEYNFVGNCTTAITLGLARIDSIDRLTVFCQDGGMMPPFGPVEHLDKITLAPCWGHDRTYSLMQATRRTLEAASGLDAILFNTYVTAYGRSGLTNGVGLLLPTTVSRLTGKPVIVYMHNFVETQKVEDLGYHPSRYTLTAVHLLERSLLTSTDVVVPLESQAKAVESKLGTRPKAFFFPFLEGYLAAKSWLNAPNDAPLVSSNKRRILLMGTWGPQKDLKGALTALGQVVEGGSDIEVSVVGVSNPHFPEFLPRWGVNYYSSLMGRIRFTGALSDPELFLAVQTHDLLILPYNGTGGYSGAMNFATMAGIPIIAYDHQQLREQAALIGAETTFVSPEALVTEIRSFLDSTRHPPRPVARLVAKHTQIAEEAIARFAELLVAKVKPIDARER